jgi:hypothetical protein
MATIMASHISRNIAADPAHVWPGIRIHIMDMVHPPGMSIPPDIETQKYTVAATLAANTKATTA